MWVKGEQTYNRLVWKAHREDTLKKILIEEMGISIRMISELKREKAVRVNGEHRLNHDMVYPEEIVSVELGTDKSEYEIQEGQIEILYEDNDVIAVNKPPYLVVHPTKNYLTGTLLNFMEYRFREEGIFERVRFISRLDRDTSGILLIAKNKYAHFQMSKEHQKQTMQKIYLAIVEGIFEEKSGTVHEPIGKVEEQNLRREVFDGGQDAVTEYTVVKEGNGISVVRLIPKTGRTHQLRCHMAYIGHPILGDELYGGNTEKIKRQALHSTELSFSSPREDEKITLKAKLPQDMQELFHQI